MPKLIPIDIGSEFGLLQVIGPMTRCEDGKWRVLCQCKCGNTKMIWTGNLRHEQTKSCGCLIAKVNSTHGQRKTPEYSAWANMKARCMNSRHKFYDYYGGRGIMVHQEWVDSFESFLAHIGFRPSKNHSIDRIDNNKGYEPGNVRWATKSTQMQNRSTARYYQSEDGSVLTINQAAKRSGHSYQLIYQRVVFASLPIDLAMTLENKKGKQNA